MNRRRSFLVILTPLLVLFSCTIMPFRAHAVAPASASFTVSPAVVSVTVSDETPAQSATITITNQYSTELRLSAELYGIDEGAARIVPTGKPTTAITSAVSLSATDITIPAHGYQTLTVTVNDSAELSDGGHYAALVVSEQSTDAASSLFRSAASIPLFIVKDQNIRTNLKLLNSSISHNIFTFPSSSTVTLQNLGNTRVVPRGSVSIYKDDTLVGKAVINTESQGLFPTKQADFTATFERYGRLFLPHRLRAVTMYRIDGSDVQLIKQSSFWYIPLIDLLALAILAAVLYGTIRYRRKLVRALRSLFRRKHRRSITPVAVVKPRSSVDMSTKSTIGQVVLEAETQDTEQLGKIEPIITDDQDESSLAAEPKLVTSIPRHINVVSLEEPMAQPTKKASMRTTTAKKKISQVKAKQPKKTITKVGSKTTKPKPSTKKVTKTTKTAKKISTTKTL